MLKTSLFSDCLSKSLDILFLCSWYPHVGNPGQGIFIKRHAECLALQHRVTVVFARSSAYAEDPEVTIAEQGNLREVVCLYPKLNSSLPVISSALKLAQYQAQFDKALQQAMSGHRFDVVHLNVVFPAAIPALRLLKKRSLPMVITEHWSGYYPEDGNYRGYYMKRITRQAVAAAKAVLVISGKLKAAMQAQGLQSRYYTINNVVDTNVFKPQGTKKEPGVLKILHVSSLVEREKNILGIIETACLLKQKRIPFRLEIVGGTSESVEEYKNVVSGQGLSDEIMFHGQQSPELVAKHMNAADVFLLMSHFEGMPVVLLEAMACGLPVISTRVGAVPAMVSPQRGLVLEGRRAENFAEALAQFDRGRFESSESMHRYIHDHYGYEAVCKSLTGIYGEVLG